MADLRHNLSTMDLIRDLPYAPILEKRYYEANDYIEKHYPVENWKECEFQSCPIASNPA